MMQAMNMTQYEMTVNLSEKCNVTLEEARTALEAGDWNMLTATHILEREQFCRMRALDEVASDCDDMAVQAAAEARDAAVEERGTPARAKADRRARGRRSRDGHIRRLAALGIRNRFVVCQGDAQVLKLPVIVLAALMLCAFWVCVPLLVIGLFAGCRYSFSGAELGRADINNALGRVSDAAERMKASHKEVVS